MLSLPTNVSRRTVISWSLYDLANTVFFLLVATKYLPKQLAEWTGSESTIAFATVPAMLLSALFSPALGALVDRGGRARALTLGLTIICCLLTAAMGVAPTPFVLALLYLGARLCYELAGVPYNALLPALVGRESVGVVSGIGVALGYAGNLVAIGLILAFGLDRYGYWLLYLLAAAFFFVFTLPLRCWVPEPPPAHPGATSRRVLVGAWVETFGALRRQLRDPARRCFFLGTFLVCDVVNTVIVQVARFAEQPEGLGLSSVGVSWFLLGVQLSCVAGGFLLGRASDRRNGRWAMLLSVALLASGLAIAQFGPSLWLRVGAIGTLGGAGLAGVWACSRQWIVHLVPPAELGEAFGVYGLVQRASLLTLYPFTLLDDRTQSYAGSVGLLLLALVGGFVLLWRAPARVAGETRAT